jgi:hypothetical protein
LDEDISTASNVFDDPANYVAVLAKLYAGLHSPGRKALPVRQILKGSMKDRQYLRMYWYAQELSTDEAIIGWNDRPSRIFMNRTER